MLKLVDYTLGETLYEGTETRVQRGLHNPSGERVVVKQAVSDAPPERILGRLLHEHRILTKLAQVRGVARLRALEQQGGSAALVLAEAGAGSLDRVLAERGRLSVASALHLALSLCRVLEGVHAVGVVHKDIKPQNVLVDEAYAEAVLVDFGIASELAFEAAEASIPEALEGTLAYISPEQTGRTARGLDSRTDLYSLGVLLFEALAGRRPFVEKDALALVYAHLAKTPPALESVAPGVPSVVSRIVDRCLSKHPEQRYQTAKGLAADIERVLQEWTEHGRVASFALGQKDFSPKLSLPQTLVSRETESEAITLAFERAAAGAMEVLLLGGQSGVGKTTLVRSVYREIAKAGRGLLLSGKHDQLARSAPYAALAQAFTGLLNSLTASPEPVFEAWRVRLDAALGPNARVIADFVPELEWLMGPLAPVPVVPTEMAYNRLKLSWIAFVRAVTDASPPLVLFLDDMQWVDPASLELLKVLLTDVGRKHLLVIAAYRDNEVEPSHPLFRLIEELAASGAPVPRLTVGPLDEASVQTWLTLALEAEPERVRSLADALYRKTRGNPFFLGQLLLELHRQKRVWRNLDDGVWQWDQDAVDRAAVTDNVVELMLRQVVELPAGTQDLLGQAACAGHSFSLGDLAVLSGSSPEEVATELWPAVLSGLVLASEGSYRQEQALLQAHQKSDLGAHYRFLHDRVQQAFYERIAPEQRAKTHLLIGRRLEKALEQQGRSNRKLLEMVRHLNLGAAVLSGEGERKELAWLNLRGARAAKASGSYRLEAMLVEHGQALLGERAWEEEPALSVELGLERIEADFMLRAFDEVHQRAEELLSRPLPVPPRLAAQELRMRTFVASGQYGEGLRFGLGALAEHGICYPESNDACVARALSVIGACDTWLDQHPEGFSAMPADLAPEHLLRDALEASVLMCAGFGSRPALASIVMVGNVHQAIERSTLTPATPLFFADLAQARSALLGEHRGGARWAREGEQAATRLASPFFPECSFLRGVFMSYESPAERSRAYHRAAVRAATASGSFHGITCGLVGELYFLDLWAGRSLSQVATQAAAQQDLMKRAGDVLGEDHFALATSYTAFLRTPQCPRPPPEQDWLGKSSRIFAARGNGMMAEQARILEAHLFLAFGEHAWATERAEAAECFRTAIFGTPPVTDIPLWQGLSAAKRCLPSLSPEERASLLATLSHAIERFHDFAEGCAENFGHKLRLLEAEQARLQGRTDDALLAYDDAIEQAHAQGFLHIAALAAQFSADFHLSAGREHLAGHYLHQACDAYTRWDALALVAHLQAQHPTLLRSPAAASTTARVSTEAGISTTDSTTTGGAALDVGSIMKAAQAISGEVEKRALVDQLMRITLENGGARRGWLILDDAKGLMVIASAAVDDRAVNCLEPTPLERSPELSSELIRYVVKSRETLVLQAATREGPFRSDTRLLERDCKSIVAVPLLRQGRLIGVLCLENDLVEGAFTPDRVQMLRLLATQAAISLENASLYEHLEARVAERTTALAEANDALAETNKKLEDSLSQLRGAQKQLSEASRRAGMAEIATSVLHNIGNVLNSVNLSCTVLTDSIKQSRSGGLAKAVALISEQKDLGEFFTSDERGKRLPAYLGKLNEAMGAEQAANLAMLQSLEKNVDHIKVIIRMQQTHAKFGGVTEKVSLAELVDDTLRLNAAANEHLALAVAREIDPLPVVEVDRHKLSQILMNLLSNARHAVQNNAEDERRITVRVLRKDSPWVAFEVEDCGCGIAEEHMLKIFNLGFTTKTDGHGFGLHSSSCAAIEMGGKLTAHSDGPGSGALFRLLLPLIGDGRDGSGARAP